MIQWEGIGSRLAENYQPAHQSTPMPESANYQPAHQSTPRSESANQTPTFDQELTHQPTPLHPSDLDFRSSPPSYRDIPSHTSSRAESSSQVDTSEAGETNARHSSDIPEDNNIDENAGHRPRRRRGIATPPLQLETTKRENRGVVTERFIHSDAHIDAMVKRRKRLRKRK
ncbi:hypothetical protein RYX36_023756 [Vicia faba]